VPRGVDLVDQILALDPGHRDIAAFFNPGVSAGACDGVTRRCEPTADGLGADIHAGVVDLLRLASRSGIMGGGRAGRRKRS